MKAVVVDVFNGEGYSEPTVTVVENRASIETLRAVEEARLTYCPEDYLEEFECAEADVEFTFTEREGDDAGAIHIKSLPVESKVYILLIQPDTLSVSIYGAYDSKEQAMAQLESEMNKESNAYDIDDIEDYDGEDVFASHGNDGFDYFKIVQG